MLVADLQGGGVVGVVVYKSLTVGEGIWCSVQAGSYGEAGLAD